MAFITLDDFRGKYVVAKNSIHVNEKLEQIIEENTLVYLSKVVGVELANLINADLVDGVPVNPDFLELYNPFIIQETNVFFENKIYSSIGMKKMLLGFVYFEIIKASKEEPSLVGGTIAPITENSTQLPISQMANTIFNESVYTAFAIQIKCEREREKYPTYHPTQLYLQTSF
jgi:hypothetical protein